MCRQKRNQPITTLTAHTSSMAASIVSMERKLILHAHANTSNNVKINFAENNNSVLTMIR